MGTPDHPPQTPGSSRRKLQKHSLQPQIFLQLEFSSPEGKTIDPSRLSVLKNGWRDTPNIPFGSDNYTTHIRVEHCGILAPESTVRMEDPWDLPLERCIDATPAVAPGLEEDSSEFTEARVIDKELSPSPTSVVSNKVFGRHDHLLEPLPNELFNNVPTSFDVDSIKASSESNLTEPSSVLSNNVSDIVDVRGSSLDLFAPIDLEEIEDEKAKVKTTSKRGKSKQSHIRRRHSSSALEIPEGCMDNSLTPKRGRKKSVCSQTGSFESTNKARRHSTGREGKSKSTSTQQKSVRNTSDHHHHDKTETSTKSGNPSSRRPSSRKSMTTGDAEVLQDKTSSHGSRKKHHNHSTTPDHAHSSRRSTRSSSRLPAPRSDSTHSQ